MASSGPIRDVLVSRIYNDRPEIPAQIAGIVDVLVDLATDAEDLRYIREIYHTRNALAWTNALLRRWLDQHSKSYRCKCGSCTNCVTYDLLVRETDEHLSGGLA